MAMAEIDADELIQDLKNGDDWHRMIAAANLGSVKDTRAIVPLEEALKDNSSYVRANAALSLGVLINVTKGEVNDTKAVNLLIEALKDNSSYVRANAAWSLGVIKDVRAVDPLMLALEDNDSFVRFRVAWALGELNNARLNYTRTNDGILIADATLAKAEELGYPR
jgi:HEAT repeat protein